MTDETYRTSDGDDRDPEAERIVSEIEETRSDMGATIDEIGHRLQPQTIAEEAKEKIREATVGRVERIVDDAGQTAQRTGNTIIDTIRQNPVPAALAGIGIGWLAMRMRDQGSMRRGGYRYAPGYGNRAGYGGNGHGDRRGAHGSQSGALAGVQEVAGQTAERAQQAGSDIQRAAQTAIDDTRVKAQEAQWQAQSALQDAQWQFDRTYNENPLALGALAVGVGAAVALAIPETQKERELMGEPRDRLVEQVNTVATQALDQAQERAQEVTEQLRSES